MMPVLQAVGIRKAFAGVVALDGVDVEIEQGQLFGLVGANGAGKTTVLNVIGGQVIADGGVVLIAGQNVGTLSPWRRAGLGIGRTFQESRMWSDLTAEQHFRVAIDASRRIGAGTAGDHTLDMCAIVELPAAALACLPAQMRLLDRRRVELAMAALNASQLLLIDEIGAGLGIEEARTLYRLIAQLIDQRRVRAAVLVEHKLELLAAFATQIGLVENGKISQRADCSEAAQVRGLMDRMFDRGGDVAVKSLQERRIPQ